MAFHFRELNHGFLDLYLIAQSLHQISCTDPIQTCLHETVIFTSPSQQNYTIAWYIPRSYPEMDDQEFDSREWQEIFPFSERSRPPPGVHPVPSQWTRGLFLGGKAAGRVKIITHLKLRLWISGAKTVRHLYVSVASTLKNVSFSPFYRIRTRTYCCQVLWYWARR